MIIRCAILLLLAAVASFTGAMLLDGLRLIFFAELLSKVAIACLFIAFAIFLFSVLGLMMSKLISTLLDYFSQNRRLERKLLYQLYRIDRLNRLFYFKKIKMSYLNRQSRQRLLKKSLQKQNKGIRNNQLPVISK